MELPGTMWIALFLLISILSLEIIYPKPLHEGFQKLVSALDEKEKDN